MDDVTDKIFRIHPPDASAGGASPTTPIVCTVIGTPVIISGSSLATVVVQVDNGAKERHTLVIASYINLVVGQKVLITPYQAQNAKGAIVTMYTMVTK